MSKKYKSVCSVLNYIEHFLIIASTVTGCISFVCFFNCYSCKNSSGIRLKMCLITAAIKNNKLIIKRNKSKHDKKVLLAKTKLNSIEILVYKTLIDWKISHEEFIFVNNVLKEYHNMKEKI